MTDGLREAQQAEVLARLVEPGRRRQQLVAELAEVDGLVKALAIEAVALRVPYRRVTELTGVPIPTVARWAQGARE